LLFKIVVFLLILLVFRILANAARRVVARSLSSSKVQVSKLLENMITSMVSKIVMIFGLLVALSQFGISLGPLLAGFGVAGIIIGFALQDTLSNFASGMMILFYRPFDVGDLVEAGTVFGKVSKMTLVSTTFLTLDHQTLVVPNTKIWGDVIKNVTAQRVRRVDMVFGIGYDDDIPKAEKVLWEILKEHPKVLDDPEPMVKLHNLGDSSVDFVVRPWVDTDDYWDVHWDITREVKMRFDAEGIGIPFPQRDVHIYEEKKLSA
jgi:small conductance mechanosensitive channel